MAGERLAKLRHGSRHGRPWQHLVDGGTMGNPVPESTLRLLRLSHGAQKYMDGRSARS